MQIVIDSNVWISAIVFGGNPRRIFERAISEGWTIAVSEEIFTEIRRVLNIKFPDFVDDFENFQTLLQPYCAKVRLGGINVTICRDEDDNRIIETALIGTAEYIITGDKDLLILSSHEKITIVTPLAFLDKI